MDVLVKMDQATFAAAMFAYAEARSARSTDRHENKLVRLYQLWSMRNPGHEHLTVEEWLYQ